MEIIESNVQSDTETYSAPYAVSATDPALEAKHVFLVNAEFGHLLNVSGKSNEVLCNMLVFLGGLEKPVLRGVGIRGCFSGGECFGCNQEERSFWIRVSQSLGHMCPIDVGDEMELEAPVSIWFESFSHHDRSSMCFLS